MKGSSTTYLQVLIPLSPNSDLHVQCRSEMSKKRRCVYTFFKASLKNLSHTRFTAFVIHWHKFALFGIVPIVKDKVSKERSDC